jgi:5'-deoxynucleotidase YfbR-like HD superfamily hydrolase
MKETIEKNNLDGCIRTYTGKKFDLYNPTPEMIDIKDIAKGLSYNSHFGGQTPRFFSIAEHSLMVSWRMVRDYANRPDLLLLGLLHDAAEAYVGDMIKPIKVNEPTFVELENGILRAVCEKWELDYEDLKIVKQYDNEVQEREWANFYNISNDLKYMNPDMALNEFLGSFDWIMQQIKKKEAECLNG